MKILIVDDNEINRKVITGLLDKLSHVSEVNENAEDALERIQKEKFDVVLMDVELPGMNGDEATRKIREIPDETIANIPVIALTGNVMREDIERFYAASMNAVVAKPIDPDKLKVAIQKAATGEFDNPRMAAKEHKQENLISDKEASQKKEEQIQEMNKPEENAITEKENNDAPKSVAETQSAPIEGLQNTAMDLTFEDNSSVTDTALIAKEGIVLNQDDDIDEDSFATAIELSELELEEPVNQKDVFDKDTLGTLKDSLGAEQLEELIVGLLEKTDEIVDQLVAAIEAEDIAEIGARAHELKGMAGNFGLTEISSIAGDAEKIAKNNETGGLQDVILHLPTAKDRAIEALKTWMAS